MQVRFDTSARLGLEDWPSDIRPDEIEQVSEALQLAYPADPQTGRVLPARLRIKLVAPDFRVDGQPDRLIEVPPDEYSKRLAFLLTPLRAGSSRINVEVYGLDELFLGAVPVEIVAVAGAVSEQEICVGNLVLDVVARQVAALLLGARIAAAASPAPLAAADAGSAAITMPGSSVPIVEGAASQIAAAGASARSPETQTLGHLTGRGDPAEQPPKRRLSRVARVTAPIAVVVVGVAVLLTIRNERQVPASVESTPAAAPTSASGVISAPATAPAAAPAPGEPQSTVTAKPGSPDTTAAAPVTARRGAPRPVATPEAAPLPVAPVQMEPASANTAKGLIAQGNLPGAARALAEGLKDNPKNSELTGTIQQLYRIAEADATTARSAADAAGAKDRPEYAGGNERLQTARGSSRTVGPENAEAIVREFGAAAELYRTAAARVKTAAVPDPRAVDELAIRKLLADYVEAYNSMDVQRVRRFKPSFTGFPRDLSSTQLTISDIRIVLSPDRQTAAVTLTAQYRNTFRKGVVPAASALRPVKLTWRVQRTGDAWILLE